VNNKNNIYRRPKYYCKSLRSVMVMFLCSLAGCLKTSDSGSLNEDSLRLLRVSGKGRPYFSKSGDMRLFEITNEQANNFVASLSQIQSVKVGRLSADEVDYEFGFQAGRNPIAFQVHIVDDHLIYAEREYLYEGGDSKAFKQIADSITAYGRPTIYDDLPKENPNPAMK
jgi:hypothetical protein